MEKLKSPPPGGISALLFITSKLVQSVHFPDQWPQAGYTDKWTTVMDSGLVKTVFSKQIPGLSTLSSIVMY
jgi:hypothetical protein